MFHLDKICTTQNREVETYGTCITFSFESGEYNEVFFNGFIIMLNVIFYKKKLFSTSEEK